MRNKATWFLLAMFLLAYLPSDAQFSSSLNRYRGTTNKHNPIKKQLFKRMYIGVYGWQFMDNPITLRVRDTMYADADALKDKIGGREIDTTFSSTAKMRKTVNAYLGFSIPLAMATPKSMFCLDIEANVLAGELFYDTAIVPLKYKDMLVSETIPFMMGSLPISFNYKYGGDATLSKDNRTLLSAGAGIATSYTMIDDNSKAKARINAIPFVKAEVGFVLGVAIKLRGTAYLGNYQWIDYKAEDLNKATGIIERKTSGQFGYNLSVIIMPMALGWEKPSDR